MEGFKPTIIGIGVYIVSMTFMVGALYNKEDFEDGTCDTTLQCAVGFITLSVVWTRNIKE